MDKADDMMHKLLDSDKDRWQIQSLHSLLLEGRQ